jgi:hypothetical protein
VAKIKALPPYQAVGKVQFGDIVMTMRRDRARTLSEVDALSAPQVMIAYEAALEESEHEFHPATVESARDVVKGALQIKWLEFYERPLSARLVLQQEDRIKEAATSLIFKVVEHNPLSTAPIKQKKRTGPKMKDIMITGLLNGTPDVDIIADIHQQIPGSKAGKADVAYYKSKLRKEGLLPPAKGRGKQAVT